MAVKPIIDIDIDPDQKFERFYALFKQFHAETDELPESWKKVEESISGAHSAADGLKSTAVDTRTAFALAAAQVGVISEELAKATSIQNRFNNSTEKGSRGMSGLRRAAEGMGEAISFAGGWMLKLGGLLSIGGLLSGFGIADLANSAFSRFKTAGSVGLTPGQYSSFQINASPFLGVDALSAAANVKNDITKAGSLAALGIDFNDAQSQSTPQLALTELLKARRAYLGSPKGLQLLNPAIQAYLALGGNIGDVRNAASYSEQHIRNSAAATARDASSLELPVRIRDDWNGVHIALEKAGVVIESSLVEGLTPLTPIIGKLSGQLSGLIAATLKSPEFGELIKSASIGLRNLTDFVGSKEFLADFHNFEAGIHDVAVGLGWLGHMLNGDNKPKYPKGVNDFFNSPFMQWGAPPSREEVGKLAKSAWNWLWTPHGGKQEKAIADTSKTIIATAKRLGVDPFLALATGIRESGLNPFSKGDYSHRRPTSYGVFQLHEGGELGNLTPQQAYNAATNAGVALSRFSAVMKETPSAVLRQFSKLARAHDPNLTHAEIMALAGTPGEYAAVAQRPGDAYHYAEDVNSNYDRLRHQANAKPPRKPRVPQSKAVHVSITNSTASRVAVLHNATAAS